MISQNLFDETLLENQDVFDYTDEEAVKETIDEFLQQQQQLESQYSPHSQNHRLEHLSLTHPSSPEGKYDRDIQNRFVESLDSDSPNVSAATSILKEIQQEQQHHHHHQQQQQQPTDVTQKEDNANHDDSSGIIKYNSSNRTRLLSLWYLILQNKLWSKLAENYNATNAGESSEFSSLIEFVAALFPDSPLSLHPLAHDLKRAIAPFWFEKHQEAINEEKVGNAGSIWFRLLEDSFATIHTNDGNDIAIPSLLAQLAHSICNGCEDNKKSFVRASLLRCCRRDDRNGLALLMDCLGESPAPPSTSFRLVREVCRLIAVLSKYQPLTETNDSACTPETPQTGGAPVVSSAHANVKEFHRAGAVPRLHRIARESLQEVKEPSETNVACQHQDLLCESMAALRGMAIDNDIVQNMIALGILDTVHDALEILVQVVISTQDESLSPKLGLATATLGLVRNLCANDEVKTTICKSSLPSILQVMQHYLNDDYSNLPTESSPSPQSSRRTKGHANLQEHACGILAAMALRQPHSAHAIVEEGGHVLIFQAMRAFPDKVTLQRQGCLAVRNIASRLARISFDKDKTKLLDAGAEDVLKNIAGRHPASSEEAYAALRDLGCNPQMFQLDEYGNTTRRVTEAFGTVKSNFRPVYE
eukprot:jgi/Psemu1/202414/e_gw1.298.37.1